MSAEELSALLVFATAMSFTPGPNTTLSAALAANFGLRRAVGFIVAVPTGWTLMMLASGLGLGALVLALPALRLVLKTLGIAYLAWMAWKLALAAGWVTSAGGQPAGNPAERLAIVCGVMLVFALTSNLSYALVGSLLREWLSTGRRLLWFNRVMAALLLATAAWMVRA